MRHTGWVVLASVLVLAASGCGDADTVETADTANTADTADTVDIGLTTAIQGTTSDASGGGNRRSPEAFVEDVPTPDVVVRAFLTAMRDGDHEIASSLLTDLAREQHEINDTMTGSKSATFEVLNKVTYVADNEGAHVKSKWTDTDPQGNLQTSEILWVMRREPAGWRVAGNVTTIKKLGGELAILNFENRAEMEAEIQRINAKFRELRQTNRPSSKGQPTGSVAERPGKTRPAK